MKKPVLFLFLGLLVIANASAQNYYRGMEPGDAKSVSLQIPGDEIRLEGSYYLWEPGRSRRSANYETFLIPVSNYWYWFDQEPQDINTLQGVQATILMMSPDTYVPEDPMAQAPIGGFTIHRYMLIIEEVEP